MTQNSNEDCLSSEFLLVKALKILLPEGKLLWPLHVLQNLHRKNGIRQIRLERNHAKIQKKLWNQEIQTKNSHKNWRTPQNAKYIFCCPRIGFSIYWKNKLRNFKWSFSVNFTSSTAFFCLAEATKDLAPTSEPDIFMNWDQNEIPRPKTKRRRGFPPTLHRLRLFAALFADNTVEGAPIGIESRRWKLRPIRLAIFSPKFKLTRHCTKLATKNATGKQIRRRFNLTFDLWPVMCMDLRGLPPGQTFFSILQFSPKIN